MMNGYADWRLIEYVNREINTGKTEVVVPYSLVQGASQAEITEVRRLCKLAGVTIRIHANY